MGEVLARKVKFQSGFLFSNFRTLCTERLCTVSVREFSVPLDQNKQDFQEGNSSKHLIT